VVGLSVAHRVLLRKTGGVLRFRDHGGAAVVYKSGKSRGICVEIVLDFSFGAVGFLVTGAQRAPGLQRAVDLDLPDAAIADVGMLACARA
jgi:hypothetical protein